MINLIEQDKVIPLSASFITGIVIGNSRFVFQRSTFLFHDGMVWLSQITMFVVLGLLINPKDPLEVWLEGLLIALVLIFVARPLIVAPTLALFGFNKHEITLVSWVGLRGSVPIILAIFPLMYGLDNAHLIFDVVFFVVLLSAMLQGSTLSIVAKKLGLAEDPPASPAATLEITSLNDIATDIVEYTIGTQSRAVGHRLSQLALPEGSVVAMITREKDVIPPRGSTQLRANDHLFVMLKPENRPFIDRALSQHGAGELQDLPIDILRLKGTTHLRDIRHSYGIVIEHEHPEITLDQLFHQAYPTGLHTGCTIQCGAIELHVIEMVGRRIVTVGLRALESTPEAA